jgi:hypothetical protein
VGEGVGVGIGGGGGGGGGGGAGQSHYPDDDMGREGQVILHQKWEKSLVGGGQCSPDRRDTPDILDIIKLGPDHK